MTDPSPKHTVDFPPGRQFALTMSLGFSQGGQTKALFSRCRAIAESGDVDVTVLTFDFRDDYDAVEAELTRRGEFTDRVHLRNLWASLATANATGDTPVRSELDSAVFTPIDAHDIDGVTEGPAGLIRRQRFGEKDRILQTDYLRSDGTMLVSERYDCRVRGKRSGTSVVLCDTAGTPARAWHSVYGLFFHWFDTLIDGDDAYAIVDSKAIARELAARKWNRERLVLMHQVHSTHLKSQRNAPIGQLRTTRVTALEEADAFDAVALLTERQRQDVYELLGRTDDFVVVPNTIDAGAPESPSADRDRGAGVVVSRLAPGKNISAAIRAVDNVNTDNRFSATLSIYGDGPRRRSLDKLISKLGAGEAIRLEGYSTDIPNVLSRKSYLLMTSSAEGFALVIVESMASGCIPIAFDVPYGPADIISHGVNGFLVPPGDVEGLSEAIRRIRDMPADRLREMRAAARRRAADFSGPAVARRWAEVMRDRRATKDRAPHGEFSLTISSVTETLRSASDVTLDIAVTIESDCPVEPEQLRATCVLRSRESTFRMRLPAPLRGKVTSSGKAMFRVTVPVKKLSLMGGETMDVFFRLQHGSVIRERRIPFPARQFGVRVKGRLSGSARPIFAKARGNLSIRLP